MFPFLMLFELLDRIRKRRLCSLGFTWGVRTQIDGGCACSTPFSLAREGIPKGQQGKGVVLPWSGCCCGISFRTL